MMMVKQLPMFKGFTVDVRLRQFRKANSDTGIVFVDFDSELGDALLAKLVDSIDAGSEEGRSFLGSLLEVL